jgi:hypothetical protein
LRGCIVVWRWIRVARPRKWRRQTICIWRWLIMLAVASCRSRVWIARMIRILMIVSKFNRLRARR